MDAGVIQFEILTQAAGTHEYYATLYDIKNQRIMLATSRVRPLVGSLHYKQDQ
jgi:hypothetical protein